jgi:hypothetical protein
MIEGHDGGSEPLFRSDPFHPVYDQAVSSVHTVIGAYGHRARAVSGAVSRVVEHFHPEGD